MSMGMENRIIDIETTLAHHDEQIAQMSDLITDQWKQIEALKKQLSRLSDKLEQGDDGSGQNRQLSTLEQAAQDKPPHY